MHAQRKLDESAAVVQTKTDEAISTIHQQISSSASALTDRVSASMVEMDDRIDQAAQNTGAMAECMSSTIKDVERALEVLRDDTAKAHECRDEISKLTQDLWSLTGAAQEQSKELAAAGQAATERLEAIERSLRQSESQTSRLTAQTATSRRTGEMLSAQQIKTKAICESFEEKIDAAKTVNRRLNDTCSTGRKMQSEFTVESNRLAEFIEITRNITRSIEEQNQEMGRHQAMAAQATAQTQALENRMMQLQEALADPMATMQQAQAQAEELNDVHLAVKRILRSISQAGTDVNERMKALNKMLVTTERAADVMKQWVDEAATTRERLEASMNKSPSLLQTHPAFESPDLERGPVAPAAQNQPVSQADLAVAQRFAPVDPIKTSAGDQRAKQAAARHAERLQQATPQPGRLRPEEIKRLIEAAKNKAAAKT